MEMKYVRQHRKIQDEMKTRWEENIYTNDNSQRANTIGSIKYRSDAMVIASDDTVSSVTLYVGLKERISRKKTPAHPMIALWYVL